MTAAREDWLGLMGHTAVVTGAGGGIGTAVATELARCGAAVAILDVDEEAATRTAEAITHEGGTAFSVRVDIADPKSVESAIARVYRRFGSVDVLVNNAGVQRAAGLAEVALEDWRWVLDVNLTGYLLCSQAVGRIMRKQGHGSLIHISSIAAAHPQAWTGSYSVSKAAVTMLSKALAFEWGPDGVRSNSVAPGMTRTPLTERFYHAEGVLEARSHAVPLRRVAAPQDLANVCAWLASDRASYVTGQEIGVDGGFAQTLMDHVPRPGFQGTA